LTECIEMPCILGHRGHGAHLRRADVMSPGTGATVHGERLAAQCAHYPARDQTNETSGSRAAARGSRRTGRAVSRVQGPTASSTDSTEDEIRSAFERWRAAEGAYHAAINEHVPARVLPNI
jgi:hypothetical protein